MRSTRGGVSGRLYPPAFRRWHRLRSQSGSLWAHKSTHHFDLLNWWLDADPVSVSALGSLQNYGKANPFRHTHCRPCQPRLVELYVNAESADGYHRDGCVFREDIDIYDTMNAVVQYSNGVNLSYSVNTFMPIEAPPRAAGSSTFSRCPKLRIRNISVSSPGSHGWRS